TTAFTPKLVRLSVSSSIRMAPLCPAFQPTIMPLVSSPVPINAVPPLLMTARLTWLGSPALQLDGLDQSLTPAFQEVSTASAKDAQEHQIRTPVRTVDRGLLMTLLPFRIKQGCQHGAGPPRNRQKLSKNKVIVDSSIPLGSGRVNPENGG